MDQTFVLLRYVVVQLEMHEESAHVERSIGLVLEVDVLVAGPEADERQHAVSDELGLLVEHRDVQHGELWHHDLAVGHARLVRVDHVEEAERGRFDFVREKAATRVHRQTEQLHVDGAAHALLVAHHVHEHAAYDLQFWQFNY